MEDRWCPACLRRVYGSTKICPTCGIHVEVEGENDPLIAEMWAAHIKTLTAIRKSLAFLVAVALLSVIGAILLGIAIAASSGDSGY